MEERGGRMKEREGGRKAGKCVSVPVTPPLLCCIKSQGISF